MTFDEWYDSRESVKCIPPELQEFWREGVKMVWDAAVENMRPYSQETVKAITKERDRLKELLDEVRLSGVESDLPGIDYVTVQIDRRLWQALQEEES